MKIRSALALAMLLATSVSIAPPTAPARAEIPGKQKVPLGDGPDFTVPVSKIVAPKKIAGLKLESVQAIIPGADYGLTYRSEKKSGTLASLYISRNTVGDASMWFDWVGTVMDSVGVYGKTTDTPAVAFTPKAHNVASGLMRSLKPAQSDIESTGVALFVHGDYVIKLRLTSSTLSPQENAAMMQTIMDSLSLPILTADQSQPVPAYIVANCAQTIGVLPRPEIVTVDSARGHEVGRISMSAKLTNYHIFGVVEGETRWCHDPVGKNVYRPDEAQDRWVLIQNDSYLFAGVGKSNLEGLDGYLAISAAPDQAFVLGMLSSSSDPRSFAKQNGFPMISIAYLDETGAATIKSHDEVMAEMEAEKAKGK